MKFAVNVTENIANVEYFEINENEENDMALAVENMSSAVVSVFARFADVYGGENKAELLKSLVHYMQLTVDDYMDKTVQESQPEYPYEEMEAEFINWIYGQGYDDPYAFADRYEGVDLTLDFRQEGDEISVYFADENGIKQEEIGVIPTYLFEDEPEMASAMCMEYTSVAVLCFDKLYSGINNPLRNLPADNLEKRIKEKLF